MSHPKKVAKKVAKKKVASIAPKSTAHADAPDEEVDTTQEGEDPEEETTTADTPEVEDPGDHEETEGDADPEEGEPEGDAPSEVKTDPEVAVTPEVEPAVEPEVETIPEVETSPPTASTYLATAASAYTVGICRQFGIEEPSPEALEIIMAHIKRRAPVCVLRSADNGKPHIKVYPELDFFATGVESALREEHGDSLWIIINRQLVLAKLHWEE